MERNAVLPHRQIHLHRSRGVASTCFSQMESSTNRLGFLISNFVLAFVSKCQLREYSLSVMLDLEIDLWEYHDPRMTVPVIVIVSGRGDH